MTGSRPEWIADAERDAVADQLREHFALNRIDKAELDARLDEAFAAPTRAALREVTSDLPAPRPAVEPVAPAPVPVPVPPLRRSDEVARLVRGRHGTRALGVSVGLWACGGILFGFGWLGSGPARLLIVLGLLAIILGGRPRRHH